MGKKDGRRKIARYYEIQLFDESKWEGKSGPLLSIDVAGGS